MDALTPADVADYDDEDDEAGPPRGRRRGLPWSRRAQFIFAILLLASLAGLALYGWRWWSFGRFQETTNNAYIHADSVVIAPKIAGYVEAVLVRSNQEVVAGQPLVRIDTGPFAAALAKASADVAARQADIRRTEAELGRQGALIAQSEAQATEARLGFNLAEREAIRYAELARVGADTRQRADVAIASRDEAAARVAAAGAGVDTTRRVVDTLRAQLGQNAAALQAALAAERQARIDLAATTVRASQAGLVGDKSVAVGQFVQAGTRLMSVVPVHDIYLEANLKETQIGRVRAGQPVKIAIDALPDADIRGVVLSRAPGTGAVFALLPPDNATGNFTKIVQRVPIRIRIDAPADVRPMLVPGLSATVSIDTRERH